MEFKDFYRLRKNLQTYKGFDLKEKQAILDFLNIEESKISKK